MNLLLLLLGCPSPDECPDKADCADTGGGDTDDTDLPDDTDDTDDTDEPDGVPEETGLLQMYYVGEFELSDGAYVDATFGYGFWGLRLDDWACRIEGTLPYEGEAPAGCPGCEWAFDLGGVEGSVATGEYCAEMGLTDGYLDGYVDYAWGFASTYYYDYNGDPLPLESALFLYVDYWFPFAFNYGGRNWVFGETDTFSFERPVVNAGSYVYYYYYPY